ncbi:hypothetical protein HY357_04920, partial [Candidatus Roizmanbacteria bacterium]|nr:hypothetical protein [Candidatus Roizmanbacteria bacterium]
MISVINKKVILFDIDRTILNTERVMKIFIEEMLRILGNPHISEFLKAQEEYLRQLTHDREFVPEHYVKRISRKFRFPDEQALISVFFSPDNQHIYEESVYPEV